MAEFGWLDPTFNSHGSGVGKPRTVIWDLDFSVAILSRVPQVSSRGDRGPHDIPDPQVLEDKSGDQYNWVG